MQKESMHRWKFVDETGEFELLDPDKTSGLYFPLANESGMMGDVTPTLSGDLKTGQNNFLLAPVSIEDLHNSNSSRNFWLYFNENNIWSATGNSAAQKASKFSCDDEKTSLNAGFLWHKVTRENTKLGIKAQITNFVPVNDDKVELMCVTLENIGNEKVAFTPTAAVPVYGRSADNLRDHRHVTSLLHQISTNENGVIVKPTLSFDERGHKTNEVYYAIQAAADNGASPVGFIPVQEDFVGEGGSLDWPLAIVKNSNDLSKAGFSINGYEAIGAIRFEEVKLQPNECKSFIIIMSVNTEEADIAGFVKKYGSLEKFNAELGKNKEFWKKELAGLDFSTSDKNFDMWMKWVEIQPILRRIYGCSFLPHHDYGRGGRGWRDLWQDCLALLLITPSKVRSLLYNNYGGVRLDGSNATIIGSKPGEFVADRNNISRTWMDHGAWPYYTTRLYVDLSGDLEFLLEDQVYFKDKQCSRSRRVDSEWSSEYGNKQKDKDGNLYKGTILEHILLEQITAFYNVGEHNNIKLEGADWNDAFDMAAEKGESVAFTAFYASNLLDLSKLLTGIKKNLNINEIALAEEILVLIDSLSGSVDYNSVHEKNDLLDQYFKSCIHNVSGKKVMVDIDKVAQDLAKKAEWLKQHITSNEWIKNNNGYEWFNGYYDNAGKALEGDFASGVRMTLTGQVFPIMGGVADENQISKIISSVNEYLFDEKVGGVRLNTNFNEIKLNMGRCFGFAFGHKENGAMFSHMTIMYINALYKRGFAKEGFRVLDTVYKHCSEFEKSRIYPGVPEYVNERGRGMYSYLTGAASWLMLTVVNEVFGVKGLLGDLIIEPKLVKKQFDSNGTASVFTVFRDKKLKVDYINSNKLEFGEYGIKHVQLNGKVIGDKVSNGCYCLDKNIIDKLDSEKVHNIVVELG